MLNLIRMESATKHLSVALAAGLLLSPIGQGAALANPPQATARPLTKSLTVKTGLSRQGLPGRRTGGGARDCFGSCMLAAIAPEKAHILTAAAQPRFLFYLPEMTGMESTVIPQANGSANRQVEFILRDSRNQIVYEAELDVTQTAGFLDIDLAKLKMTTQLRPNEDYRWQFSIIPNAKNRAHDIDVIGSVRRVLPQELAAKMGKSSQLALLNQAPSLAQAKLYQDLGLWQDSVSTLVNLMEGPSRSAAMAQLQTLIKAEGTDFGSLAQQPIQLIASRPINIASGEALPEAR
jgi:Domain of Unknown Function (DUF928)